MTDATNAPTTPQDDLTRSLTVTWSDPVAALQRAMQMTREEFLAMSISGEMPPPPIAAVLGFDAVHIEPGQVTLAMRPAEFHTNGMNVVAAGVSATILDGAMWLAVQLAVPEDVIMTTVNLSLNLVRQIPPAGEELHAEARAVHTGRTIGTGEGRLVGAESGKLYAHATTECVALTSLVAETQ